MLSLPQAPHSCLHFPSRSGLLWVRHCLLRPFLKCTYHQKNIMKLFYFQLSIFCKLFYYISASSVKDSNDPALRRVRRVWETYTCSIECYWEGHMWTVQESGKCKKRLGLLCSHARAFVLSGSCFIFNCEDHSHILTVLSMPELGEWHDPNPSMWPELLETWTFGAPPQLHPLMLSKESFLSTPNFSFYKN